MKIRVKLLDRNLIRSFGGVIQDMEEGKAQRFISQGKAVIDGRAVIDDRKMSRMPPNHKAIFHSPEDKLLQDFDSHRFPGPEDKLFPNVRKGK